MLNKEDYMKIFHEIKNSVAIINSYLQLVEKKHPEISAFDYWSDSMAEVSRLKEIVTELSQVKLGDGLKQEQIDLYTFLSGISNSFHRMVEEADFDIMLTHPCQPIYISADSSQLHHVFHNLLKNSYEAMGKNGTIQIDISKENDMALVTLTDFGGGFDAQIVEHAFDPFASTKENGSGLGLVIVRQIIMAHNGTISFNSRPGDGCTFFIRLPLMNESFPS